MVVFVFCFFSMQALQVGGGLWLSKWTDSIVLNKNDISTSVGIGVYTAIGGSQRTFILYIL